MIARTVFLAAAVILGVGIGTAFAESHGSGINQYQAVSKTPAATPHAMAGQSAGDATPGWVARNGSGGGG